MGSRITSGMCGRRAAGRGVKMKKASLLPFPTEASVSPWGGDPTAILKHFMPATYSLGMIVSPSPCHIASPREGLTIAGPLRGCSPAGCAIPMSCKGSIPTCVADGTDVGFADETAGGLVGVAHRRAAARRSNDGSAALYPRQLRKTSERHTRPHQIAVPVGRPGDARRCSKLHLDSARGVRVGSSLCGHTRRPIYSPDAETGRRPRVIAGPPPRPGDWVKYGESLNPVSDLAWIKCCRTAVGSPRRGPSMALGDIDHTCPRRTRAVHSLQ
ncbi:hypothetical protein FIU85_18520 [Roseovarius sp. THAF8]|nr:hypothetical protein FIU85_18520 [Roseovarius sp. THAF8]